MVLTEEQKERIRKNRERALAIQHKRLREEASKAKQVSTPEGSGGSHCETPPVEKKIRVDHGEGAGSSCGGRAGEKDSKGQDEGVELELEEFEVGASEFVTKKEAMKMYLIPEGTLAICKFEEKPNPHNKKFQPMKLYDRAEIRRLSRERFGGLNGVIEERRKRQDKRFYKDLDETKNLFRK
mmetsp:Transcript_6113/g.12255  ORF Transcript_6113/g.12255 Transcript_6113/m.12255 type:complete len:182 (+) Transcript_6113:273-818(+)|eukprot:scaffold2589_cov147-Amphora_coffeaeformis.AAC.5